MINITNIGIIQMLLASALIMAASGEADTPSPWTSAQSASPEQSPSEANQAKAPVGGTGVDAGSLEDGLAAEKRGNWKAAFLLLEPLAEQGNADAQTQIGFMFETGRGHRDAPPDTFNVTSGILATQWYSKAALQGNAQAQVGVGRSYKHCCGPNPGAYAEAMKWFRKAADQGYAEGQLQLGYMYDEGKGGVTQDYVEAMKWFRKAADQGYAQAQVALGFMYEGAQGVPQDYGEAMKWYRKAADQGNADAQEKFMHLGMQVESDTIMKPKLAARKEIGDTVCYPSACTDSGCFIYGQVENLHNDKIEVRVHVSVPGFIGPFGGTPSSNYDKLEWVNYDEVIKCAR